MQRISIEKATRETCKPGSNCSLEFVAEETFYHMFDPYGRLKQGVPRYYSWHVFVRNKDKKLYYLSVSQQTKSFIYLFLESIPTPVKFTELESLGFIKCEQ